MENFFKAKYEIYDEEVLIEEQTNSINLLLEGNSEKEIEHEIDIDDNIFIFILKKK